MRKRIRRGVLYCVGIYSVHKETDALSKERQLLDTQREDLAKEIENYNETLRSDSAYSSNPESAYSVRQNFHRLLFSYANLFFPMISCNMVSQFEINSVIILKTCSLYHRMRSTVSNKICYALVRNATQVKIFLAFVLVAVWRKISLLSKC